MRAAGSPTPPPPRGAPPGRAHIVVPAAAGTRAARPSPNATESPLWMCSTTPRRPSVAPTHASGGCHTRTTNVCVSDPPSSRRPCRPGLLVVHARIVGRTVQVRLGRAEPQAILRGRGTAPTRPRSRPSARSTPGTAPGLAVPSGRLERRDEAEVRGLVVRVALEDPEVVPRRGVRVSPRAERPRRAPDDLGVRRRAPPRAARSPSPRRRPPRGSRPSTRPRRRRGSRPRPGSLAQSASAARRASRNARRRREVLQWSQSALRSAPTKWSASWRLSGIEHAANRARAGPRAGCRAAGVCSGQSASIRTSRGVGRPRRATRILRRSRALRDCHAASGTGSPPRSTRKRPSAWTTRAGPGVAREEREDNAARTARAERRSRASAVGGVRVAREQRPRARARASPPGFVRSRQIAAASSSRSTSRRRLRRRERAQLERLRERCRGRAARRRPPPPRTRALAARSGRRARARPSRRRAGRARGSCRTRARARAPRAARPRRARPRRARARGRRATGRGPGGRPRPPTARPPPRTSPGKRPTRRARGRPRRASRAGTRPCASRAAGRARARLEVGDRLLEAAEPRQRLAAVRERERPERGEAGEVGEPQARSSSAIASS